MERASRITFTDATSEGIIVAAFTSLSTSEHVFTGYAPTGVTVTLDQAMPLTVMIAVGVTGRVPFYITASAAP